METKRGVIELYPTTGKVKVGLFIKYGNDTIKVHTIDRYNVNNVIPINEVKLLKYHVSNQLGIIGQLDYSDCKTVKEGDCVKVSTRSIFNKMEIGDEVKVYKVYTKDYFDFEGIKPTKLTGTIVSVNGRKCVVNLHGRHKELTLKRNMISLKKGNLKTICKII